MKFFKFEDGELKLDRDEIALYKLPNKILRRDRGSEGDADGRKKLIAFKEFTYVYFVADGNAYPLANGLSEKETHEYACNQADLPLTYKPDQDVTEFINQYKSEHWSQSKQIAFDLRAILRMNQTISSQIQKNINKIMEGNLNLDQINSFIIYQEKLINIAANLPKQIKLLTEALKLIEKDENNLETQRGGKVVGLSMNPDNIIENDLNDSDDDNLEL